MLRVVMLNVIMLSAVMPSVVAPKDSLKQGWELEPFFAKKIIQNLDVFHSLCSQVFSPWANVIKLFLSVIYGFWY
jgi:hypothetical protein